MYPSPGLRRVEPETHETVFPDGGGGVVCASDQPGVRSADRLAGKRLGHPDLSLAAIEQPDVRVFPVELLGAVPRADARTALMFASPETKHSHFLMVFLVRRSPTY